MHACHARIRTVHTVYGQAWASHAFVVWAPTWACYVLQLVVYCVVVLPLSSHKVAAVLHAQEHCAVGLVRGRSTACMHSNAYSPPRDGGCTIRMQALLRACVHPLLITYHAVHGAERTTDTQ